VQVESNTNKKTRFFDLYYRDAAYLHVLRKDTNNFKLSLILFKPTP